MKKTILYIGGFRLPDGNAAAHRVINNGKILRRAGYRVVFAGIGRERDQDIGKTRSEHYGFECWATDSSLRRLYSLEDFRKLYPRYAEDLVAVIAYNYPAWALGKLLFFCRKRGIRLISDCTEWYGAQGDNPVQCAVKGLDSFLRMRILQPRLDGIIAISSYLENYYAGKLPTVRIPALTDRQAPIWTGEYAAKPNTGRIRLVFAGELGRKKDGLNEIIEAVLQMPDRAELDILGITLDAFLDMAPPYRMQLREPDCNVRFCGRVPHRQVIEAVKSSDFAVFYRENTLVNRAGFPTKFVESTACGTPVITTNTSDLAHYLIPGVNGFFLDREDPVGSLKNILSQDAASLRRMKAQVRRDTFDISHYYILGDWMNGILTGR